MSHDLPDFLVGYLMKCDQQRADAVNAFLNTLTDRERALVKDAAVMGYVTGMTHPKGNPYPGDASAVLQVIEACQALPDLYQGINATPPVRPATDAWTIESCYDPAADKWHGVSTTYDSSVFDNAHEMAQADFQHRAEHDRQHRKFRMIRATTTYTLETEYDPAEQDEEV